MDAVDKMDSVNLHPLPHLIRGVWLQALRRNEIYVMAILLGIYVAAAVAIRALGLSSPQAVRFVADLGLQLGSLLASLLVILMGARQLTMELELRTIYPILAKPVTRSQVLLGKALPVWLTGAAGMALFALATLALTPHLPYQHAAVMAQAFMLKTASLAMLTALVFSASLWLPSAVAMLVAGLVYFAGPPAARMLVQVAGDAAWARALAGAVPDFSLLHQFDRFVNGGAALGWITFAGFLLYAALWTALFGALAARRFRSMML